MVGLLALPPMPILTIPQSHTTDLSVEENAEVRRWLYTESRPPVSGKRCSPAALPFAFVYVRECVYLCVRAYVCVWRERARASEREREREREREKETGGERDLERGKEAERETERETSSALLESSAKMRSRILTACSAVISR